MRKSPMKEVQPLQHQASPTQGSGDVKNDSRILKQAKNFLRTVSEDQDGFQEEMFKEEEQTQAASTLHPEIHPRVLPREARRDEIHQRVSCPMAAGGDEV